MAGRTGTRPGRRSAWNFLNGPSCKFNFDPFLSDRRAERRRFFGAESRSHLIDVFDERFFGDWTDEWLAKEEKSGLDDKTMAGKTRFAGYLKDEFGRVSLTAINKLAVLTLLRKFEDEGKLETRDRVRSIGEQIFDFADLEGSLQNPFRGLKKQLVENKATPRPAVTKAAAVAKLFKDIAAPFKAARFGDVVGKALRFLALTAVRPGEIASAEWCDFDLES